MSIVIQYQNKQVVIDAIAAKTTNEKDTIKHFKCSEKNWSTSAFLMALRDPTIDQVILSGESEESVLDFICQKLKVIVAGGGIVTDTENRLLFIYRRNKWDLPKGKIETDESIVEGAAREIEEETGLNHLIQCGKIMDTYHLYECNDEMILKPCHWYHFKTELPHNITPQTEEEITEIKWFSRDELHIPLSNTFENIAMVTATFLKTN